MAQQEQQYPGAGRRARIAAPRPVCRVIDDRAATAGAGVCLRRRCGEVVGQNPAVRRLGRGIRLDDPYRVADRIATPQDLLALRGMGKAAEVADDIVDEQDVVGGNFDPADPDRKTAVVVPEHEDRLAWSGRVVRSDGSCRRAQSGYSGGVSVSPGSAGVGSVGGGGDGKFGNCGGSDAAPTGTTGVVDRIAGATRLITGAVIDIPAGVMTIELAPTVSVMLLPAHRTTLPPNAEAASVAWPLAKVLQFPPTDRSESFITLV